MTEREHWGASADGMRVEIERRGGSVYLEDGPDAWPARGHEGSGGTFTIEEVRRRGAAWFERYDGLYADLMADFADRFRVVDAMTGVLCTVTEARSPHAVPCCFVVEGDRLYTPIDTVKPKSTVALKRVRNIASQPRVCVLVDHEDRDWDRLWWARIDGSARVVDGQDESVRLGAELLRDKYPQYADATFAAMIAVEIDAWTSWP